MTDRDGEREHRWVLRAVYAVLAVIVLGVLWGRARRDVRASPPTPQSMQFPELFVGPPAPEPLAVDPNAPRLIRWCAVERVLERRCLRCHGSPTNHGAPFSLVTHSDVTREYPPASGMWLTDRMTHAIRHRVMPPTTLPLDPPVEPLTGAEKDTLLAWLEEGALAFGGERCAP